MKLLNALLSSVDSAEQKPLEVNFSAETFLESLKFMGIGLVCIFAVVGVIALGVALLNKLTQKKKTTTAEDVEDQE